MSPELPRSTTRPIGVRDRLPLLTREVLPPRASLRDTCCGSEDREDRRRQLAIVVVVAVVATIFPAIVQFFSALGSC